MYKYSANMSYPYVLENEYKRAGSWIDDGVDIEDEAIVAEYSAIPPQEKTRSANENGYPCWVDLPPLTPKQKKAMAESKKIPICVFRQKE